ncbi:MAG: aminotransferase class I/II-fold pyridoxal phosphate-dependent enzyme [Candidatus Latescibacteria bacterium]|nr:aminotransferase class I/II-fold pyridoxal phosphate-dependent enzyme [bacterium]MBD3424269.1 aminotransferase class I/II-fold pyridoxal phosphate-dependent enzyme [Candidatus Latescibacterota bacterium]
MMNRKSAEITPFLVMDVLERAMELEEKGKSIVHMEIGEPDFDTPPAIVEAAVSSLRGGETHYTDSRGLPELRKEISRYSAKKYGVDISPDRIFVTMGVSCALLAVLSTLIEQPGDEIIISDPYYPCYPNFIRHLGGVPRLIRTRAEDGFHLKPEQLEKARTGRTRGVIINSPSNPAGTVMPPGDLEAICTTGIPVISDEIYHGLVYGEQEHSALEFTDKAFVLNGFSKLFAMTGWRLGYAATPSKAARETHIILQNLFISPNPFVQRGGIEALSGNHPEIEEMKKRYDSRRKFMLEELSEMGLESEVEPRGAFYIFVNAGHIDKDSYRLAFDILENAGVALAPGIDFGDRGEGYLRISYANSMDNLREGARRLKAYLQ